MAKSKFEIALRAHAKQVAAYIKDDAPRVVGTLAVNHAKQTFDDEGFTDTVLEPWKEVKRREDPKASPRNQTRKILSDTGDLKDSIRYQQEGMTVKIGSDLDYARPHNEGTDNAGRGGKTKLPKRQFIGDSESLKAEMRKEIKSDLKKIAKL